MGLEEPLQIQQGKAQSTAHWEEQPQAAVQAGGQTAGGPGRHQVEHELVMCPNRKKANGILGCIKKCPASR